MTQIWETITFIDKMAGFLALAIALVDLVKTHITVKIQIIVKRSVNRK